MNKTRALILAAGRGSRMKEGTAEKPKCLNKIAGRPLLNWQLDALKAAGVDKVGLVKGYKAEMLTEGDFSFLNKEWESTNMVYSLFCADPAELDTVISYSDITYHPKHVSKLMEAKEDIVITADLDWRSLWSDRFSDPLDDAETFKTHKGVLKEIGKNTDNYDDIEAQYMGLMKLTMKGWETLHKVFKDLPESKRLKLDMTSLLNHLLERGIPVGVVFVKAKWCEADTLEDIAVYESRLNEKNWAHDWR